ncbi:MAG: ABC transporter ATP-binding protein [Rhodospirillaceae bacterium]|nr:ABC transporter ATP-binding protein [Rhodospirillaceae bacterium]|tara:strand:+ start:41317 stop:42099 length:783 start_codon:yes stop_codon:yes gene_type:complete
MGQSSLLSINNVSLNFGGLKAIDELSLSVEKGTITSIIGPNGAGKTSLFNVISGFYKPSSGSIMFNNNEISTSNTHIRASMGLARTFQNISLFPGMTVLDNIKLGAHSKLNSGLITSGLLFKSVRDEEKKLRKFIEEEIIEFLEIDHIRKLPVAILSYGLQKRVELARALAMSPKLLMLDEPVAGMNREETEDMARYILDIKEERDTTVLLVEHDMKMVMDISDKVIAINFGKKISEGDPSFVSSDKNVIDAYLGKSEIL